MADQNHRTGVLFEKAFQPFRCVDIEVVCRFIQDQEVWARQHKLCEREAGLFTSRARANLLFKDIRAEPKTH